MKNIYIILFSLITILSSCNSKKQTIKIFGWTGVKDSTDVYMDNYFAEMKKHGFFGVCNGVHGSITLHERAAKYAHKNGLEYHAWSLSMCNTSDSVFGIVNRNGDHCFNIQAYVPWYKFMCPSREDVYEYLSKKCDTLCAMKDVDYIHMDFIRFPDVILARGLWEKYGLVMNEEYDVADYCYCDICCEGYKNLTGIDIRKDSDPEKNISWRQYRYDLITNLVNRLTDRVHKHGKKMSAAVFPGPSIAKNLVRQEWNKWNIDAFFPMNYNDFYLEKPEWLENICKEEVKAAGNRPVYSGLFICKDWKNRDSYSDPEGRGLIPEEIKTAVVGSMNAGSAGVCLFVPERMTERHWNAFDKIISQKYSIEKGGTNTKQAL
jgi:hypothetical protein